MLIMTASVAATPNGMGKKPNQDCPKNGYNQHWLPKPAQWLKNGRDNDGSGSSNGHGSPHGT